MKFDHINCKKIKGDASFRIFYRKKISKKTSIVVVAKKEKKKNLLIYDAINRLLLKNKIIAPKLLSEKYNKNYIEIQDFGDDTVYNLLRKNSRNKLTLYKQAIDLLNKIQKIKKYKSKNFKDQIYKIPKYSNNKLISEAKLFTSWYTKKFIPKRKLKKLNLQINKQFKILLSNVKFENEVFVHRDFHVSNLMKFKKKLAIIDSQDAVFGNIAYDLASLIDDVRFELDNNFKKKVYDYFIKLKKRSINRKKFLNDFEIFSVLRNMKIIGIFTRLALRDKKKKYLNLIPYAWRLIDLRMKRSNKFEELKEILDKNFPKKIRNLR